MKIIKIFIILSLVFFTKVYAIDESFKSWKISFKKLALNNGITESTFDMAMKDVKFLFTDLIILKQQFAELFLVNEKKTA